MAWLRRKGEEGGFQLVQTIPVPEDFIIGSTGRKKMTFYSVKFDGVIRVQDPDVFIRTVENGIGSAKGFGFGLLSIAPLR